EELRVVADLVRLVLPVAREGQPEAGHPLAEARRGEEPLHQRLQSSRRVPGRDGLDLLGFGRKPGEIEGQAPGEGPGIRLGRRRETALLEPGEDEEVERLAR